MKTSRKYFVIVALLAVLAVAFGIVGTIAPPLAGEGAPVQPQQESSSESVGHFQNPPSYDSGWVDITTKAGQYVTLKHDLNTWDMAVDVTGRRSLDFPNGTVWWTKTYAGASYEEAYSIIQTSDGGYALAGCTNSSGAGGLDFWLVKTDADGNVLWNTTYGGTGDEYAWEIVQTSDGRYVLAGSTTSFGAGSEDLYLVEADALGNLVWNKTFGGTGSDSAYSMILKGNLIVMGGATDSWGAGNLDFWLAIYNSADDSWWNASYGGTELDTARAAALTPDGGFVLAGSTRSFGAGQRDFYVVKTNASGVMEWNKTYGGPYNEHVWSVYRTSDSGYALAGYTYSFGAGERDYWLVKTDPSGGVMWNKTYGGTGDDAAWSIIQTAQGEYAIAGWTMSFGASAIDSWLVKTDASGNMQWNKTYGGTGADITRCVVKTADGGYVLAGSTDLYYGAGTADFWLVKLYAETQMVSGEHKRLFGGANVVSGWNRTYGGTSNDEAYSLVQTFDGGYALAGKGFAHLVKTDSAGNKQWSRGYGGFQAYSLVQTFDGGYALAGSEFSLVKTDDEGYKQWTKTYGEHDDETYSLIQTSDGGYALAGYIDEGGAQGKNFGLVKTDSAGNLQWSRTYSDPGPKPVDDVAYSVVQTADGGYALAGYTCHPYSSREDVFLVKTDSAGTKQWSKTYGKPNDCDAAFSLILTSDGGYALAGGTGPNIFTGKFLLVKTDSAGSLLWNRTYGGGGCGHARCVIRTNDRGYALVGPIWYGSGSSDCFWVKTDLCGNQLWSKTYGGKSPDNGYSLIQTSDGGYALAGSTVSYGAGNYDFWLVKTEVESGSMGLSITELTSSTITLYRGSADPYWNYIRVRIWIIKEPSWIYGDINMDGIVDVKDLYILSRNYGKTFSLLSLSGIIAVAGIHTVKKRKQSKQPSYIS